MTSAAVKKHRVRADLESLVAAMRPGEMLPTERALAEQWGVARMTVRNAIGALVREGRLRSEQGRGTFVQPAPIALRVRLGSFAAEIARAHLTATTTTLGRREDDDPPEPVREHLGLQPGQAAVRIDRLRLGDDIPLALERAWFPVSIGRSLLTGDSPTSLYTWLESLGRLPDAGEESVGAGFPHDDEAGHLAITTSTPVIRLTRRATAGGEPVEYAEAVLPASRYQLWFPLAPGADGRLQATAEEATRPRRAGDRVGSVTDDAVPSQTSGADEDAALRMLLDLLDLREVGTAQIRIADAPDADIALGDSSAQVFIGQSQKMAHNRVFGGQVLAQGVIAAGRTLDLPTGAAPRPIHSLHAYFMRPGDDTQPIRFAVERMMDGRSFTTRRVHAIQHGRPILSMSASFQEVAPGLDHQDPMPDVPGPDGIPSLADLFRGADHPAARHLGHRPIEQRHVEGHLYALDPDAEATADQYVWMRAVGRLPDDPLLHAAVLAYASDYSLLEPALRRHHIPYGDPRLRIASLDHAMWFHRPVRMDEWVLYDEHSPSAQSGRGLGLGTIFQDGRLVATVAQEGMIRLKPEQP